ncbi:MAG: hypothetical protein JOZ12_07770 [Sinobacteraceae bacterium]|nr:hypothetical protein [Nevskiaceae bacterium]
MIIRRKPPRPHAPNEPFRHENHPRPMSRRELIGAGFLAGPAVVVAPAWLGALLKSGPARGAGLDADINALSKDTTCSISAGSGMIPFICFDLAGGANTAGSEVLVGQKGGQSNFLSTAGYGRLGLPPPMIPSSSSNVSAALGLLWHSDGAILRGIQSVASAATQAGVNGAVIPAISQNDTGNNPHNPMYGIAATGAAGSILTLVGTESTVSGGNSMAPAAMIVPALQPTKISQSSDDVGLVGSTGGAPDPDATAIYEAQVRISGGTTAATTDPTVFNGSVLGTTTVIPGSGNTAADAQIKDQIRCAYVKNAFTSDEGITPTNLNPDLDANIVGASGIFTTAAYQGSSTFRATAAVMKLVVNGFAAAGTVTIGGCDYHDSTRASGEQKNFQIGQCIGAVLEYAKRQGKPVMIYVFSDGSLVSTGTADSSVNGRGKFGWQGDNQQTATTFFLVYNPGGRAPLRNGTAGQQIGFMNSDGSVNTTSSPAANAVNLLVQTVVLNYMALHGLEGNFDKVFPMQGLGSATARESYMAFSKIS